MFRPERGRGSPGTLAGNNLPRNGPKSTDQAAHVTRKAAAKRRKSAVDKGANLTHLHHQGLDIGVGSWMAGFVCLTVGRGRTSQNCLASEAD